MTRRLLLSGLVCVLGCLPLRAEERPNILFLFADDQCFDTIGAYGLKDVDTPHLDRLVERGMTFTHCYNMGSWSGAVCVASRHMLNTGAFVWKAEKLANEFGGRGKPKAAENFETRGLMWSQLMGQAGYDTYFTGKWHVRANPEVIFQNVRNVRGGMPKQTEAGYNRPVDGQPDPWSPYDPRFGGFWEGGTHWSEVVKDDTLHFLEAAEKSEKPFFMYIAFNAPHDPRQAPKEFVDRYPLDRIEVPANFLAEYPYNEEIDNPRTLRDEKLAPFPRTKNAIRVHLQEYFAIITHMDEQMGLILDALEGSGEAENTYIFFTADHGLAVGQHGLVGKQNLYDHSMRVPMIAVGPGIEPGASTPAPVYLQDVMPTSLELAGAEIPGHVQFRSLKPVWEGESDGYESIYGGYLKSQRCVIRDGWKLLLYTKVPKIQLFHVAEDPLEVNDVYAGNRERARQLFAELLALQPETGDVVDLREVFPELLSAE